MLPTRHVGNGLSEVLTHVLGIRVLTDAPFLGRARFECVREQLEPERGCWIDFHLGQGCI